MRYLKGACHSYVLCIPYWKSSGQEVCEKYQNSLNSRRGHKTMAFPRGPFNYHYYGNTRGEMFLNLEFHWCQKITRNTLPQNYLEFQGSPTKQRISKGGLKLYLDIQGMRDFCARDARLWNYWVDTAYIRIYRQYSDCILIYTVYLAFSFELMKKKTQFVLLLRKFVVGL